MCEAASFFTAGAGLVSHSRCDCVQVQKRDGLGGGGGCRRDAGNAGTHATSLIADLTSSTLPSHRLFLFQRTKKNMCRLRQAVAGRASD